MFSALDSPASRCERAAFVGIAVAILALFAASARATDYYVDPTGLGPSGNGTNTYTTIQAAVDAVPAGTAANPTRILIDPGTYTQQLDIPNKLYLDLIGTGTDPSQTVLTDNLNANSSNGAGGTIGTTGSASTTINAQHFTASNLTFANSTPYGIAQAVALKTTGDEEAFVNCDFLGYQDTLYTTNGRDYFQNCYVSGSVDFIFGNATAVFNNSTINSSEGSTVTAANTQGKTANGIIIMNSTLTATNPGAGKGSTQLGRPWQYSSGSYASTIFLNDKIGSHISTYLWNPWDTTNTNPAGDTRYAEYGLTDANGNPLNTSAFDSWSHVLTAAEASDYTLANIFGPSTYWNNATFGVGGTLWGPVNAVGTSNVSTAITATSYSDWTLGGTWDPTVQLATVLLPEPATLGLLAGAVFLLFIQRKPRIIAPAA